MTADNRPKALCYCGHTGDGPNSQHAERQMPDGESVRDNGHGKCTVEGCGCPIFTRHHFIVKRQRGKGGAA